MPSTRELKALRINRFSLALAKAIFAQRPEWFRYASAKEESDADGLSEFHLCLTFPSEHPHGGSDLKIFADSSQIIHFVWHPVGFQHACDWDDIGLMKLFPPSSIITMEVVVTRLIRLTESLLNEETVFIENVEKGVGSSGACPLDQISFHLERFKLGVTIIRSWRGTHDQDINHNQH